jgi:hypothetical protein
LAASGQKAAEGFSDAQLFPIARRDRVINDPTGLLYHAKLPAAEDCRDVLRM